MWEAGATRQEITDHLGLTKAEVKNRITRYNCCQQEFNPGRKGGSERVQGLSANKEVEQANEIRRLQMENKMLRDFLRSVGRRWIQPWNITLYIVIKQSIWWPSCARFLQYSEGYYAFAHRLGSPEKIPFLQKSFWNSEDTALVPIATVGCGCSSRAKISDATWKPYCESWRSMICWLISSSPENGDRWNSSSTSIKICWIGSFTQTCPNGNRLRTSLAFRANREYCIFSWFEISMTITRYIRPEHGRLSTWY